MMSLHRSPTVTAINKQMCFRFTIISDIDQLVFAVEENFQGYEYD